MPRLRPALILAGLGLLSGCGWVSSISPFSSSSAPAGPPPASCPTTSILRPLAQTAVFAPGAKPQPISVAFYGILSDVDVKCDRNGDALRAALDVVVVGERGPAGGRSDSVDLQYFVAVTGNDQSVLSKRSFAVHIPLPGATKRAGVTDHIEQVIPLGGRAPGDVTIVLGFQQSPEVVDFYRHFRGR